MSGRRSEALFLVAVLAALAAAQSVHLTRPFLRQHESVGTEISKHARNHLKFGLGKTYGLKLDVSGPRLEPYGDPRKYFYANHPPVPALLMAGVFAVAGVSEAAYRVPLILFSLAAVVLFRFIARRLLPAPADRAATLMFAFLPGFAYYSVVTCLQVTALTGILSGLLFYLRWRDSGSWKDYAGILASILFAGFCSWPGYYLAPALVAAHVRSGQPRTRAVLALLGWNVAIFGLYLLQLRIASPPDLDPIRKLLGAGLDRASLQGLPLLGYARGELRELVLMFTAPILALAAGWVVSLFRRPLTRDDRLIVALSLLGLDEIVFARLASQHEYFSYFLVVFLVLAAGAGLVRLAGWIESRRPSLRGPAAGALVALVLLQGGWMLQRRLTTEGAYEFYWKLGLALREAVPPEAHVLILTDTIPFYTPYYGDVYTQWYAARRGELVTENSGGRRAGFGERELRELLERTPSDFDAAVTAEKPTLLPHVAYLRPLSDEQLESFGVETRRTPLRELLERRCGPPREHGGFLFWKLR